MARRLFPEINGEPEVSGPLTLQGYDPIHAVKVTGVAMLLGRYAEMGSKELVELGMTAMLSNIGYGALPPGLLDEPKPLSEQERATLHTHPVEGAKMLIESGLSDLTLRGIEQHHERWDGSGYPEGRKGDEISRFAQVMKLSTGEIGIISDPNVGHIARPIVRICFEHGKALDDPYDLDLSDEKSMNKVITEVLL